MMIATSSHVSRRARCGPRYARRVGGTRRPPAPARLRRLRATALAHERDIVCGRCWARLGASVPALRAVRASAPIHQQLPVVRAPSSVRALRAQRVLGAGQHRSSASCTRSNTTAGASPPRMADRMARSAWPPMWSTNVRRSCPCRCRKRSAGARVQPERLHSRARSRRDGAPGVGRRAHAHASHRNANAVDTRGPSPQRFRARLARRRRHDRSARRARRARR